MTHHIYHPVNGELNHNCDYAKYMHKEVYQVEAKNLEEAFTLSQNDFNESYAVEGRRSTSVGDIIQSEFDIEKGVCHLILGIGFKTIFADFLTQKI